MYVLIAFDEEHGVLHPVTSPLSTAGTPGEQLGQAAEFVTALMRGGACDTYELESNQWVLEVRASAVSGGRLWTH
ncbi:MAG: hypothetical protein WBQ63_04305 [Candidatus Acidiferrales bacterium]